MKRLAILFFVCSQALTAQEIVNIRHEGLRKTKEAYLNQFFSFEKGDSVDSVKLRQTQQRLVNLEMFSDVQYAINELPEGVEVVYQYQELFTLLPIFSFGGIEENFWIQAGGAEANLMGRGNKLTTYYQYYDRSSLVLHLTLDRIRQSNWGININLIKWSTLEPLFFGNQSAEYEYDNYTAGIDVIRHLNFTDRIQVGGAYFTEDYKKATDVNIEGAPEAVSKRKALGKVTMIQNRVNYHFYYLDGWHNQLNIQTVQSLDNDPAFYIVFNDIKRFSRIGAKGNFASRLRLGLSSNEDSPFAPFVLDSYVNIRGVGNRVDRGTGAIILNAEYRHAFLDKGKIAIQGVGFIDSGTWRNPGGEFSDFTDDENFVLFAGGGARLIHKQIYNAILRIDYGINLQDASINGFVIGIGQYF